MSGPDVIWSIEDGSRSLINVLIVVSSNKKADEFIKTTKSIIIQKCLEKESKLTYIRRKMFGYSFFLKHEFSIDDYIKIIKVHNVIDAKYLAHFISYCCSNDINNSALCEVFIFNQPMSLGTKNQYFILFRIHHSLGDGFSLINFFVHNFSKPTQSGYTNLWFSSPSPSNMCLYFWKIFYGTASVMIETVLRPKDRSILHGQTLSVQILTAWTIEKEENLVPIVKLIKNKKVGTRFSDVLLTAISESFKDFYDKKGEAVPKLLTCVIPKSMSTSSINLKNEFSVAMLTLPLGTKDSLDTLESVKILTKNLRDSSDFLVHHWLLSFICAVLPEPLLKPLIYSAHSTMVISILPGTQKLAVFQEDSLEDIIFWIPLRGSTGVGISVLSYDNRFQIGITVDRAIMSDQEDLQSIVDGVFAHILRLYKNVQKCNL